MLMQTEFYRDLVTNGFVIDAESGKERLAVRRASLGVSSACSGDGSIARSEGRATAGKPGRGEGIGAITEHGLRDAKHEKIKRILPATVRRSKQPAVA